MKKGKTTTPYLRTYSPKKTKGLTPEQIREGFHARQKAMQRIR